MMVLWSTRRAEKLLRLWIMSGTFWRLTRPANLGEKDSTVARRSEPFLPPKTKIFPLATTALQPERGSARWPTTVHLSSATLYFSMEVSWQPPIT